MRWCFSEHKLAGEVWAVWWLQCTIVQARGESMGEKKSHTIPVAVVAKKENLPCPHQRDRGTLQKQCKAWPHPKKRMLPIGAFELFKPGRLPKTRGWGASTKTPHHTAHHGPTTPAVARVPECQWGPRFSRPPPLGQSIPRRVIRPCVAVRRTACNQSVVCVWVKRGRRGDGTNGSFLHQSFI